MNVPVLRVKKVRYPEKKAESFWKVFGKFLESFWKVFPKISTPTTSVNPNPRFNEFNRLSKYV